LRRDGRSDPRHTRTGSGGRRANEAAYQLPVQSAPPPVPGGRAADIDYDVIPPDGGVDLRKYLSLLLKHRLLIIGCTILVVALGALQTFLTPPMYRGSANLALAR